MRLKFLFFLSLLLLISCEHDAQYLSDPELIVDRYDPNTLPLVLDIDSIKSLRTLIDPSFQADLERVIKANSKWSRLISQKKMAVGLVDLSDPYHPIYARLNGNVMMYAASLPKIAISACHHGCPGKGRTGGYP